MPKIKKDEEVLPKPEPVKYSTRELEDFGAWLEKFRYESTLTTEEVLHPINTKEAGVEYGAYSKKVKEFGPTQWKPEPYTVTEYYVIPGETYDEFYNKYDQWSSMMARREYAENKSLKGLDTAEIANKFKI